MAGETNGKTLPKERIRSDDELGEELIIQHGNGPTRDQVQYPPEAGELPVTDKDGPVDDGTGS